MKVIALCSGGKDSTFNMMECVRNGHEIVALINLRPPDSLSIQNEASAENRKKVTLEIGLKKLKMILHILKTQFNI